MSQMTLKTPSTGQTGSSPLAWLSRAGFGIITLLAIALFGWANPGISDLRQLGQFAAGQRDSADRGDGDDPYR